VDYALANSEHIRRMIADEYNIGNKKVPRNLLEMGQS
jgi:hypothetical protein